MAELIGTINGLPFTNFGVRISQTYGIMDALQRKPSVMRNWNDYHGDQIDLEKPVFEARDISVECFIVQPTPEDFLTQWTLFKAEFEKAGLQEFRLEFVIGRPYIFMCYLRNGLKMAKRFQDGEMIGTFTIELREPEPVKRIISFSGTGNKTINVVSDYPLNIYWGDGTSTKNVKTNQTHNYATSGTHYVVITGMIDDITSMSYSTGTLLWSKLQ